ncbi:hypothetical protein [Streptomyces lydicus]|uniref:hypothetical protein n=1 Tax=Streptomyces lydicus TaxID=47763 RepID=UPI0036E5CFB4
MRLMVVDSETHDMLHNPRCELPGGLMVCDPQQVQCGSPVGATGRLLAGAKVEPIGGEVMGKESRTARLGSVRAGVSVATQNADTVVITAYVNDSKDRDRPILLELTSQGARQVAAQLLEEAKKAEVAAAEAKE